jgi:hypothetical protein
MRDETKAPIAPAAPETLTPAPEPAPETAPEDDPDAETNDALEAAVDPQGGVWRCLNERCPDAIAGATFLGPVQSHVQQTGVHVVCPGCENEPAPHYIYVADREPVKA